MESACTKITRRRNADSSQRKKNAFTGFRDANFKHAPISPTSGTTGQAEKALSQNPPLLWQLFSEDDNIHTYSEQGGATAAS